ncbi:MAG: hypothetical protein COB46_01350 [Rhodospirillaceae bacterium]|nr:MAG: hypothetical protein COB46_01350 [Rhodospirillaceae bacterium]
MPRINISPSFGRRMLKRCRQHGRNLVKMASYMFFPLRVIAALPWIVGIACVAPFVRLRFAHIGNIHRLGFLAQQAELYLRKWELFGKPNNLHVIFLMYDPDNQPLFDMFKRTVPVLAWKPVNLYANFVGPVLKYLDLFLYDHMRYLEDNLYTQTKAPLEFTLEEKRLGRNELEKMGIGPDDWFVCFHCRDNAYVENKYHDYRNSSVENMIPAMEEVTRRGGFAIRVGSAVESPLPNLDNPRIIDYACNFRTPFMDIFLAAENKFFFGSTSGIVMVAILFNKPLVSSNYAPLTAPPPRSCDPYIPKLISRRNGSVLCFDELYQLGFFSKEQMLHSPQILDRLDQHDLIMIENSSEDLHDLCLDMFDILEGVEPPSGVRELQILYNDRFLPSFKLIAGEKYRFFISPRFALKYEKLIRENVEPKT